MKIVLMNILLVLLILKVQAQNHEKRIALVIGNSNYTKGSFKTAANDAFLLGEELRKSGFEVMLSTNLSARDMKIQIQEFGIKLNECKGTGLFFFSGYGLQFKGENYLLPIDATIFKEQDIEMEAINLNRVTGEMDYAQNVLNIIILDASRKNPYLTNLKLVPPGLAAIDVPLGTLIAYSTTPDSISIDNNGINSLYTIELVNALQIKNLKLEEIFKQVRMQVHTKTRGKQSTWENSSLMGDFYFRKN